MKIKLFTHTDLDGVGCAVLAKLAFGDDVDISYCGYNNINEEVKKYLESGLINGVIHITDISVTEEVAELLNKSGVPVILLDHHKTALYLNKYKWANVKEYMNDSSLKTSGTQLYFDYLCDEGFYEPWDMHVYDFVEKVRMYDTWDWAESGEYGLVSKQMNDLLGLYGRDRFIDWSISKIIDPRLFISLEKEDKHLLEMHQKQIDDYIKLKNKQLFQINMYGRCGGFVYADRYFSEMGNRLALLHPELDFIAMIDVGGGMVSYRTVKDDINLGELAKQFGGGGHPKAAGSRFPESTAVAIAEMIFAVTAGNVQEGNV